MTRSEPEVERGVGRPTPTLFLDLDGTVRHGFYRPHHIPVPQPNGGIMTSTTSTETENTYVGGVYYRTVTGEYIRLDDAVPEGITRREMAALKAVLHFCRDNVNRADYETLMSGGESVDTHDDQDIRPSPTPTHLRRTDH